MGNVIESSGSSSAIQASPNTISYITITFIIAILAIILNLTEIHLIRRKWKTATDFEVLLLNLGIADLLSGIGYGVIASLSAVAYTKKSSRTREFSLVAVSILGFFCAASAKVVLIIGIERLLAIKLPLKHRLWHTNRKTMYKRILVLWTSVFIFINCAILSDYFIQKSKGQRAVMSRNLGYTLAAYLTLGVCTVFVTYLWLSHLVIKRATKLLNFDKRDYKKSPKVIITAVKKEKATIIVCRLVAATYLVCNVPIVVALYRGKFDSVSVSLTNLNAVINPLIYFFKGYAEKWYAKKKLAVSMSDTGGSSDNLDSPSPKVSKPESCLNMKEVNRVKQSKIENINIENSISKMNDHGLGCSGDKGDRPMNQYDATHNTGNSNLSRPKDLESESSRINDEKHVNNLQSSEEKKAETIAGISDLCLQTDRESRNSKGTGEDQGGTLLNKLDSVMDAEEVNLARKDDLRTENDHEPRRSTDRGEDQDETILKKLDAVMNVETMNLVESGDLCVENNHESRSSSNNKGAKQFEVIINKTDLFGDIEIVNVVGNGDLCTETDKESRSSKVRGEEQTETLADNINLFADVETANMTANGDSCTLNGQDFEGSSVKGENSSVKPDSTVGVKITNDNEHDESFKATSGSRGNIDGSENTRL